VPIKVELHTHTSDDPQDYVPFTTAELIDRAATLGYQALAITLHDWQLDLTPFRPLAQARGLMLVPGVERTIEGKHVLLLNFTAAATAAVTSFDGLARLRRDEAGLVVAPHPFYPLGNSLGAVLDRAPGLFDALEINAMHAPGLDFNRRARRWAAANGRPLVGGGDVHRLAQLGSTYSLIECAPDAAAVCDAVRAGRVAVESQPLPWTRAVAIFGDILAAWVWTSARKYRSRRLENRRAV
jgi:predicted metal-dependent phosphoesterase TrpH